MKNCGLWLIALVSLLSGCASGGYLPGESRKILQNIAGEYYTLAASFAKLERYEEALTHYKLAMRDEEYYAAAFYESARMNVFLSRWDEAKTMYETLLEKDPKNKDLLFSVAYIEAMSGNLSQAESMYADLLPEYEWDETLHENYIRILVAEEKGPEALAAFDKYLELFPTGASGKALSDLLAKFKTEEETEETPAEEENENPPEGEETPEE
jgi:tetratricopeptide (TPR) repeat protein